MENLQLHVKTKLCYPKEPSKTDFILVTRGATAVFTFDLTKIHISARKIYSLDEILQLTFKFKQNKKRFSFNLIDYFKVTQDTVVIAEKIYFNKIPDNSMNTRYKFIRATGLSAGDIIAPGSLYEQSVEVTMDEN